MNVAVIYFPPVGMHVRIKLANIMIAVAEPQSGFICDGFKQTNKKEIFTMAEGMFILMLT